MARTAVPITAIPANTATADPAGTDLDATNHHVVTLGSVPLHELVVRVTNTTASTKAVTIKAGDNPPADAAGVGDLSVSLTAGDSTPTTKLVVLTSARFAQNDGTLLIDVGSGMTGKIAVLKVARG